MDINPIDIFVAWTPVACAALALFMLFLLLLAVLIWRNQAVIVAWFDTRWGEKSTAHARTVAITVTLMWLLDQVNMLPPGQHVPILLVRAGWVTALALFVWPDANLPDLPALEPSLSPVSTSQPAATDSVAAAASPPAQEG
jgi:hypothetical protein